MSAVAERLSPRLRTAAARVRSLGGDFWRYLLASVVALGFDFALLYVLTEIAGFHYLVSSAISYSLGGVLHYALSVALVFKHRRVAHRGVEFAAFFAIGFVGLAANQAILAATVEWLHLNYMLGKVCATGGSFILNFVIRRAVLFTSAKAAA